MYSISIYGDVMFRCVGSTMHWIETDAYRQYVATINHFLDLRMTSGKLSEVCRYEAWLNEEGRC